MIKLKRLYHHSLQFQICQILADFRPLNSALRASEISRPDTYRHLGEFDTAWFRRAAMGAWSSRVPREKQRLVSLWLKLKAKAPQLLTNLIATSSFVRMFVPRCKNRNGFSETGCIVIDSLDLLTVVYITKGTAAEFAGQSVLSSDS